MMMPCIIVLCVLMMLENNNDDMNAIIQTAACIKRNNRFILLFLGFAIVIWLEVLCSEKTVIPQLLSNPIFEGFTEEDIIDQVHGKRLMSMLVLLLISLLKIVYVSFVLFLGNYYINSAERKGYIKLLKVAVLAESINLVYRLYNVVIQFLGMDISIWDIKERFSLIKILNTSDMGVMAEMLNFPLTSVNVISITYCLILTFLVSRVFENKFVNSLSYVLSTYVLVSVVLAFLASFIMFIYV